MTKGSNIDISVDAGESYGSWRLGHDDDLFAEVTSVNVACGFHAGDPRTMWRAAKLSRRHGVQLGAHPGLRDLVGFGRRELGVDASDVYSDVLFQLGALGAIAAVHGVEVRHVSPHGALGWMTWRDPAIASAVVEAARSYGENVKVVCLEKTALADAAERAGMTTVYMGFPERGYQSDGRLAPRGTAGAVITDPELAATRAVTMATSGGVEAVTGEWVAMRVDTLLIHGDNPAAVAIAKSVRRALASAGVKVSAF